MSAGLFFLAIGIAAAGYFIGCGFEEFGAHIHKGMSALAVAIAPDDTFDPADDL